MLPEVSLHSLLYFMYLKMQFFTLCLPLSVQKQGTDLPQSAGTPGSPERHFRQQQQGEFLSFLYLKVNTLNTVTHSLLMAQRDACT